MNSDALPGVKLLLTAADVARMVRVHRSTVVRWADAGVGPAPIRFGMAGGRSATVRFDAADVERWLRESGRPAAEAS